MNDFLTKLTAVLIQYGVELFLAIIVGILSYVLSWVRSFIKSILKRSTVSDAVHYVEQMYKGVSSSEKYTEALKIASEMLDSYNIKINESELKILIESAVNEFFPKVSTVKSNETA